MSSLSSNGTQELLDNVEGLCALDRPASGSSAGLSGGLLDTRAYRIKRSQLQVCCKHTAVSVAWLCLANFLVACAVWMRAPM